MKLLDCSGFEASELERPGAVFIDERDEQDRPRSYLFRDPVDTLIAETPEDVSEVLSQADARLRDGNFLAGFISYDAGFALDMPSGSRHSSAGVPLIWLGVYDTTGVDTSVDLSLGEPGLVGDMTDLTTNVDRADYLDCVRRIKEYIAAGDVFQVNYTSKLKFRSSGSARSLFARLRKAHPVPHAAFVNAGDVQVISLSPELFVRRRGGEILTRPMKGTCRRGRTPQEDEALRSALARDVKNRAENAMIVDLMRNDLGRLCRWGSVNVARAFHVERFPSVHQMTSDVVGSLRKGTTVTELARAVFPPGSVTGAPKIRAMQIIDELEAEARGVYCGSVGAFFPDGDFLLNVAIRTIVQRGSECEMGIGGGIVADSDPEDEFAEARLKSKFLWAEAGGVTPL